MVLKPEPNNHWWVRLLSASESLALIRYLPWKGLFLPSICFASFLICFAFSVGDALSDYSSYSYHSRRPLGNILSLISVFFITLVLLNTFYDSDVCMLQIIWALQQAPIMTPNLIRVYKAHAEQPNVRHVLIKSAYNLAGGAEFDIQSGPLHSVTW